MSKAGEKKTVCKVDVKYVRQMGSRECVKLAGIESVMWMGSSECIMWLESRVYLRGGWK